MIKIYVEEVIKCVMERLTKEYGLTEQQALKEIDMCMEKTVCEMDAERTDTGTGTFQNTLPGKPGRIRGSDSEGSKGTVLQIINY